MRVLFLLLMLALVPLAVACESCRPEVRAAVLDSNFIPTLLKLALPVLAVVAVLPRVAAWIERE